MAGINDFLNEIEATPSDQTPEQIAAAATVTAEAERVAALTPEQTEAERVATLTPTQIEAERVAAANGETPEKIEADRRAALTEEERVAEDTAAAANTTDELSDLDFSLEADMAYLGVTLTDEELDLFDKAGLDNASFGEQANTSKYLATMLEVFKTRHENDLLGSYKPENLKILDYLENGGDIGKYANTVLDDYSNLTITEADTSNHQTAIAKLLIEQSGGTMTEEKANHWAKLDIADGDGFKKATEAAAELKKIGSARVEAERTAVDTAAQQSIAKQAEYKTEYSALAKGGKVKIGEQEFVIPEKARAQITAAKFTTFKDKAGTMYDANGLATKDANAAMSILDVMKYNMGTNGDVLLDYFIATGGYKDLAVRTAATQGASSRRSARTAAAAGTTTKPNSTLRTTGKPGTLDFTLEQLTKMDIENKQ